MSLVDNLGSFVATAVRLGRGLGSVVGPERRSAPERLLELWDFEACPYCRKVREVLSELDLDYLAHPVARGSGHRAELVARGGKMQAPYLADPNTRAAMYESDDIIGYLNSTYGGGARAGWRLPVPSVLDDVQSALASAARLGRGARARVTRGADGREPLLLYNMEGSPYCRKVREILSELDLAHIVRNLPHGSPKRAELVARGGKMQVPYLVDPNTGRELYESDDIAAYLEREYGEGSR
jgi:glutathione S-transferase